MNKIRLGDKEFYYQVFYKNIKNMYLRYKNNILIVSCNNRVRETQIEKFMHKNSTNILGKIQISDKKKHLYNKNNMLIFGREYFIKYQINCGTSSYFFTNNTIHICFKQNYFNKEYIEQIYHNLLMAKMSKYFLEMKPIIENYFNLDNITFKTQLMKSQFGSCITGKRIIKLNTILARFDEAFVKIILIHELIHLKVHNHQKEFYKYINIWIPNYKSSIKHLNNRSRKYVI